MSNFFKEVVGDLDAVEQDLLGPDYNYAHWVKSPGALGMSKDGNLGALANDAIAMIQYVEFLVAGGGGASVGGVGPLGDRFFLRTGAQCSDVETGNKVKRSIYVDNIPNGHIPGISAALGENFPTLEGILPGTIFSLGNINPLAIFQAFMSGTDPSCQAITMPTRDVNNVSGIQTEFMTLPDIANISPCLFEGGRNPVTKATIGGCRAGEQLGRFSQSAQVHDDSSSPAPAPPPPQCNVKTGQPSTLKPSCNALKAEGVCNNVPFCSWGSPESSPAPAPPPPQCNVKTGQPSTLKPSCNALKAEGACNNVPFCTWGSTESFQNQYPSQSYIGDCSEIISYLYIGLMIILICYVLTRAAKKR
jgi:hypothetical protein